MFSGHWVRDRLGRDEALLQAWGHCHLAQGLVRSLGPYGADPQSSVCQNHANIEETSNPIRAVTTPYSSLAAWHLLSLQVVQTDAINGSWSIATHTIYDIGPTKVGCWS